MNPTSATIAAVVGIAVVLMTGSEGTAIGALALVLAVCWAAGAITGKS